jgi:translation initiation factor IF-1
MVRRDAALRVAREEGEIYAQAVKIMGGNIASAIDINGNLLRAHIRGKFRGRGKHDNFIGPGTWLLVGLHDWQSDKINPGDLKDCDILEVYNDMDKIQSLVLIGIYLLLMIQKHSVLKLKKMKLKLNLLMMQLKNMINLLLLRLQQDQDHLLLSLMEK